MAAEDLRRVTLMLRQIVDSQWADVCVVPEYIREEMRHTKDWPYPEAWPSYTWRDLLAEIARLEGWQADALRFAGIIDELETQVSALIERAERERDEYAAAIKEAHSRLDEAGVPTADNALCNDGTCNTKLGHRIKTLIERVEKN